jgi:F0F1-type ATP synthase assembly protein I
MLKRNKIWSIVAMIALLAIIIIGMFLGIGFIIGRMVIFIGVPVLIIWLVFFRKKEGTK